MHQCSAIFITFAIFQKESLSFSWMSTIGSIMSTNLSKIAVSNICSFDYRDILNRIGKIKAAGLLKNGNINKKSRRFEYLDFI